MRYSFNELSKLSILIELLTAVRLVTLDLLEGMDLSVYFSGFPFRDLERLAKSLSISNVPCAKTLFLNICMALPDIFFPFAVISFLSDITNSVPVCNRKFKIGMVMFL